MIEGKHLAKGNPPGTKMGLLPPPKDKCQECAVDHPEDQPHNAQSMFYQYKFYNDHGRWPTWTDAMEHCPYQVKTIWTDQLKKAGVDIDGGKINPSRGGR